MSGTTMLSTDHVHVMMIPGREFKVRYMPLPYVQDVLLSEPAL